MMCCRNSKVAKFCEKIENTSEEQETQLQFMFAHGQIKKPRFSLFCFFYFCGTHVHFLGPLISLFRTSGNIPSVFQSPNGQPYLHFAEAYVIYVP